MNITFNEKPFDDLTPEEIKLIELEHVNALLLTFNEMICTRLCDPIGRAIVAEYEFRGNLQSVISQLEEYSEKINTAVLSSADIAEIRKRKEKLILFGEVEQTNNGHSIIETAVKTYDMNKIMQAYETVASKNKKIATIMHENHECLCYTNTNQ